jgi:hypothetical protein
MLSTDVRRRALSFFGVTTILAGCGGLQPGVPAAGVMPHGGAPAARGPAGSSWMLREAKGENLVYVSTGAAVYALAYPSGKVVGVLDAAGLNLCSDTKGHIFLTQYGPRSIVEYQHGATNPIATLSDVGYPWNCSVDPTSGNLAVTNMYGPGGTGNVAVYSKAQGYAQTYVDATLQYPAYCTYDNHGNLFVDGVGYGKDIFTKLPSGGAAFKDIAVNRGFYGSSELQWDGKYVTIDDPIARSIYRVKIVGGYGIVAGITRPQGWYKGAFTEVWLQGNTFIGQPGLRRDLAFWPYPAGGKAKNAANGFAKRKLIYGVTLSLAPK